MELTKAVIISGDMCAWGLQPSDDPNNGRYYRKGFWLVVSANRAPFFRHLGRHCPGQAPGHQHVELRGNLPNSGTKRTKDAAQYPWRFARAVALALHDATRCPPTHPGGGGPGGRLGRPKGPPTGEPRKGGGGEEKDGSDEETDD